MPEIAAWMGEGIPPEQVVLRTTDRVAALTCCRLTPPDPWEFARNFEAAAQVLEPYGIETVLSSANLNTLQCSFCPVGKDALIVSPDGRVDACYLLPEEWERNGLDMRLGRVANGKLEIEVEALERARLTVHEKPRCAGCLCRYHCAGGCHVNHDTSGGTYDELCLQTRLITIAELLKRLGQAELADAWLNDRPALEVLAWQTTDELCRMESWG